MSACYQALPFFMGLLQLFRPLQLSDIVLRAHQRRPVASLLHRQPSIHARARTTSHSTAEAIQAEDNRIKNSGYFSKSVLNELLTSSPQQREQSCRDAFTPAGLALLDALHRGERPTAALVNACDVVSRSQPSNGLYAIIGWPAKVVGVQSNAITKPYVYLGIVWSLLRTLFIRAGEHNVSPLPSFCSRRAHY